MKLKQTLLRGISLVFLLAAPISHADDYPSKPIRIMVPYAPGGIADVVTRLVGARFGPIFAQPVIVENRTGANGTIASQYVAQARPDGYTLLLGNTSTQVINRFLYKNLPFDIEHGFQPIGLIVSTPMLLVVSASSPLNSVPELLTAARAAPNQLNFGSAGNGAASHLALVMLTSMAKVEIGHVPYRGTSQIVPDLIGGRLSGYFDVPITALGLIQSGKVKPLAVASLSSQPALPNVPTIAKTIPGFELSTWLGLFAPAGTPRNRVEKLNLALRSILDDPGFRKQLVDQGNEVIPNSPQEFDAFIQREAVRIGDLIAKAGIRAE